MSVLGIILLILLGVLLFLVEFFIIPGVTIAGIGGALVLGVAVFASYRTYGTTIGTYTLLTVLVISVLTLVLALRSKTWKRLC
jgi:membrane-bound ClpP family serine protease